MKTNRVIYSIHDVFQHHCSFASEPISRCSRVFAAVALLVVSQAQADAPWFDTAWPNRQQVTISGTLATETLTNFPVSVQFSDQTSSMFRNCQVTGQDIVFTAADGITQLAHDIDTYTPLGTKALIAWVRVPELSPGSDTVLYLYYGNPTAADQQNKGTVWSEYAGVWHLGEDKPGWRRLYCSHNKALHHQ